MKEEMEDIFETQAIYGKYSYTFSTYTLQKTNRWIVLVRLPLRSMYLKNILNIIYTEM